MPSSPDMLIARVGSPNPGKDKVTEAKAPLSNAKDEAARPQARNDVTTRATPAKTELNPTILSTPAAILGRAEAWPGLAPGNVP